MLCEFIEFDKRWNRVKLIETVVLDYAPELNSVVAFEDGTQFVIMRKKLCILKNSVRCELHCMRRPVDL